jgi:hypothetical protein
VSLSNESILKTLKDKFVCGWRDISSEPYCGKSGKHDLDNPAVHTTNGAGPTNTQLFILSPDGVVLHCLPGYWDARDLPCEIELAEALDRVWKDPKMSREEKDAAFKRMHLEHVAKHPADMVKRSQMQGFDKKHEQNKVKDSDCLLVNEKNPDKPLFKTTDRIMHERIANQPFVSFDAFDVPACVRYGRPKYDKKGDDKPGEVAAKPMKERKAKK